MISLHIICQIDCHYPDCLNEFEYIFTIASETDEYLKFRPYHTAQMTSEIMDRITAQGWHLGIGNFCPDHTPKDENILHVISYHSRGGNWWRVYDIEGIEIKQAQFLREIRDWSKDKKLHRGINEQYASNMIKQMETTGFYSIYWLVK